MITLDCMRDAENDNMILGWAASVAAETGSSVEQVISALYFSMKELSEEN
jgi:hypothetical protein